MPGGRANIPVTFGGEVQGTVIAEVGASKITVQPPEDFINHINHNAFIETFLTDRKAIKTQGICDF